LKLIIPQKIRVGKLIKIGPVHCSQLTRVVNSLLSVVGSGKIFGYISGI